MFLCRSIIPTLSVLLYVTSASAQSYYAERPSDPFAIYLTKDQKDLFGASKVDGSSMVLGFAGSSTLLAINNEKSVTSVQTDTSAVAPVSETQTPQAGTVLLLPVGLHNELWTLQTMLKHVGYIVLGTVHVWVRGGQPSLEQGAIKTAGMMTSFSIASEAELPE